MKNMVYGMMLAFQFLTRIPIPVHCPWNERTIKWALRFFPVIGLVLGVMLNGLLLIHPYIPEWMVALLLLTGWIGYTGGLHLDGWMDVSDAVSSNGSVEKKREIMKDPHIGSFAVLSLIFLLVWKWGFLYELCKTSKQLLEIAFMLAPSLSRWGGLVFMYFLPTWKNSGLAWEWKRYLSGVDLLISFIPILVLCGYVPFLFYILFYYLLFLSIYMLWSMKGFKGINGDLVGTVIEGGELWILMGMWIYILFVMG